MTVIWKNIRKFRALDKSDNTVNWQLYDMLTTGIESSVWFRSLDLCHLLFKRFSGKASNGLLLMLGHKWLMIDPWLCSVEQMSCLSVSKIISPARPHVLDLRYSVYFMQSVSHYSHVMPSVFVSWLKLISFLKSLCLIYSNVTIKLLHFQTVVLHAK